MKKIVFVFSLLIVISTQTLSASTNFQDSTTYSDSDFHKRVEAFIPNNSDSFTYFYSSPKGTIIDSLKSINKHQWIVLTIDSVNSDWVKLKKVVYAPEDPSVSAPPNLKNTWIPITHLYTQLNDPIQTFNIHESPSEQSPLHEYATVKLLNIIEIKGDWLKVKFVIQGIKYSGWINKFTVCAYPWTICGY